MKKNLFYSIRVVLIACFLLLTNMNSYASHILGMDLYYTWVSGNTYKITAVLYGDCSPSSYTAFSSLPSAAPVICIYRGSTYVTSISLNIEAPTDGVDITPVCPSEVGHTQCENSSSTVPGIKKFVYSANYTLPAPTVSNCWQFAYFANNGYYASSSGRSAAITNFINPSLTSIELVDTLDNSVYAHNSSAQFSVIPTPFFCLNEADTYNPGCVDPDGDNLNIDLIAAMDCAYSSGCAFGVPVTYTGTAWTPPTTPVSATTPLQVAAGTFSFNSSTGQLNFTPNVTQRSTVVYNVQEFRGGSHVGSCQREMNFLVLTCTHSDPIGWIDSASNGTVVDSTHFTVCAGSGPFSIFFDPREPGSSNNITITSSGLPAGSTLTVVGNGTTTPHGTFSWSSTGVAPGTYVFYVTYTDNNCPLAGSNTQAITITVTPAPTVTFTVISAATCSAQEAISIIPGGTGSPWNINVTGTTTQSFTGVTTSFIDSLPPGTDTIHIASAAGSTCNTYAVITIAGPIAITIAATNPTVCAPANGSFTVSGLTPGDSYTIYYTVGGTNYSVVMVANAAGQVTVTGLAAGSYTGVYAASTTTGCTSNIVTFTLSSITVTITGTFTNPTVCAPPDGTITLSGLTPGASYTLNYTESGTPHTITVTANASGQILLTGLPSGNYTNVYVIATASGCTSNVLTFVLVNPLDPPPPVLSSNGPVCADSTLLLTATDAATGIVYSWTGPNSFSSTIADPFITDVQTLASGVYNVTVTNTTTGCSSTSSITITVKPTPSAPLVSGNTPCTGGALNLTASSAAGCTYSWAGPAGFVSPSQNPTITPVTTSNSGTYTVVATLNGCPSLPGIGSFTVYPTPPAPIVSDTSYCQFVNAPQLTATGSNLLWYTSATGTGSTIAPVPADTSVGTTTWYVSQTINGCEGPKAPINVTVLYLPEFNIAGNTTMCTGDSSTFSYSGPALNTPDYTWSIPANATLVSGTITSNAIDVQFNSSQAQFITLTASDYGGRCSTTETIPVNVEAPPLSNFYVKPNICVDDTVVVALSYRSPSATVFAWNFAGANIVAANSNSGGPFSLSWNDTGIHILSLITTTDIGCSTPPVFDTVMIHGLPNATIKVPAKGAVCIHDTVVLSAATDCYNCSYAWSPVHFFSYRLGPQSNDNSTVEGIIDYAGYVKLTVIDPFGCRATDSLYMNPKPCCEVLFPNAFTPNGDNHNDVFRPILSGYHNFHQFRIVNRWGQTVFESANSDVAWDGNFNGVPQDMDVYYYYLKYDCGGETLEAKGDVTLVR